MGCGAFLPHQPTLLNCVDNSSASVLFDASVLPRTTVIVEAFVIEH